MNLAQKLVLWAGLGIMLAMGAYPPWIHTLQSVGDRPLRIQIAGRFDDDGYGWIFNPPPAMPLQYRRSLDHALQDDAAIAMRFTTEEERKAFLFSSRSARMRRHDPEYVGRWGIRLDVPRLLVQWTMVGVLVGALVTIGKRGTSYALGYTMIRVAKLLRLAAGGRKPVALKN